jgi:hypothetical protein
VGYDTVQCVLLVDIEIQPRRHRKARQKCYVRKHFPSIGFRGTDAVEHRKELHSTTTKDEHCNRNRDIKKGEDGKRKTNREVNAAGTTNIYCSRGREKGKREKKKTRNKRLSILRHECVQRNERH